MVLDRLDLTPEELEQATGWSLEPEGACKDGVCVPLPPLVADADGRVDVTVVVERLGMPIARDDEHGRYALGPPSGNRRVLEGARMPELVLPDFDGTPFDLTSLRGKKVVLVAWASW